MDGVKVLLEYFRLFKDILNSKNASKNFIKETENIIKMLENSKNHLYIVDYKIIEKLINEIDPTDITNSLLEKYNVTIDNYKDSNDINSVVKDIITNSTRGIDSILYDVFLNVNRYNIYYMNQKVRTVENNVLDSDLSIKDEINVELKDILNYLEVDIDDFDSNLLKDLNKFSNIEELRNRAVVLKSGVGFLHFMYDKIKDKEVLLSLLLHSNDKIISSIIEIFDKYNVNLNKVVDSIPSIFIKEPISSKCKYKVFGDYITFINNVKLIEEYGLDFKVMTNFPVFFVKDSEENRIIMNKLDSMGVNIKNVYEHVGNVVAVAPNIIFNNIQVLKKYGIELTDDNNNNGYTLLGMSNLSERLDYLIEAGLWKKSDGQKFDNIDLVRGLIIKDDYLMWKNNIKKIKLDDRNDKKFNNDIYNDEKLNNIFIKNPELKEIVDRLDSLYLYNEEGYYIIDNKPVSRLRFLRNLSNYQGKDSLNEIIINSLKYKSNINDDVINEIIGNLEMGDKSVKLS